MKYYSLVEVGSGELQATEWSVRQWLDWLKLVQTGPAVLDQALVDFARLA